MCWLRREAGAAAPLGAVDSGAGWWPPSSRGAEIVTQEGRGKLVSFWPLPNFPAAPGAGGEGGHRGCCWWGTAPSRRLQRGRTERGVPRKRRAGFGGTLCPGRARWEQLSSAMQRFGALPFGELLLCRVILGQEGPQAPHPGVTPHADRDGPPGPPVPTQPYPWRSSLPSRGPKKAAHFLRL